MEQQYKKSFLTEVAFLLVILAAVYITCRFLLDFFLPFVIAGILVYFLRNPAIKLSQKLKLQREKATSLLLAVFYLILILLAFLLAEGFIAFLKNAASFVPDFIKSIENGINGIAENIKPFLSESSPDFANGFDSLIKEITENIKSYATALIAPFTVNTAKKLPSILFNSLITVIASFYIAKDYPRLISFLKGITGDRVYKNVLKVKGVLVGSVFKLIKGYVILSGITFCLLLIGLFLMKFKYFFILSLIIAVIDLLPVLGAGTVLLPWGCVLIFMGDAFKGVLIFCLYGVIVLIRNILEPKIIGGQTGVNPLFILAAMFIGLRLIGGIGLVSFPIVLIVAIKYYELENGR